MRSPPRLLDYHVVEPPRRIQAPRVPQAPLLADERVLETPGNEEAARTAKRPKTMRMRRRNASKQQHCGHALNHSVDVQEVTAHNPVPGLLEHSTQTARRTWGVSTAGAPSDAVSTKAVGPVGHWPDLSDSGSAHAGEEVVLQ